MIRDRTAARRHASWTSLLLVAALAAGLAGSALAASGRDLAFGYTWRDSADGATLDNVGFDLTQRQEWMPANDAAPIEATLPWPFTFYGTAYTSIWLSDNGWVSFVPPAGAEPMQGRIPDPATGPQAMLAPFWTDQLGSGLASRFIRYGPSPDGSAYRVQMALWDESAAQALNVDVLLFLDNHVEFRYRVDVDVLDATIGIENAAGDDGIEVAGGGVLADGFTVFNNQVVEFFPPSPLVAACDTLPAISCGTTNGSTPSASSLDLTWYCVDLTTRWDAAEALYALTLTEPTQVDVTVTGGNHRVVLLDGCDDHQCLRGPTDAFSAALGPGLYVLAVDAPTVADQGPFSLTVDCTPLGTPLACGDPASGTTAGEPSRWNGYRCSPLTDLSGPETVYAIDIAATTNLRVDLSSPGLDLDVLLLQPDQGELTGEECVAWGDVGFVAWNIAPGSYLLVVDGVAGAAGGFDITTTCGIGMDCSSVVGSLVAGSVVDQVFSGDTSLATNSVETYACDAALRRDGPEEIWELVIDQPGQVAVVQRGGSAITTSFLLSACNEGACVAEMGSAGCAPPIDRTNGLGGVLPAGTYYLVVESPLGGEGDYELELVWEPPFNNWRACEMPQDPTTLDTEVSSYWNLSDAAFCTAICADGTSCNIDPVCPDGSTCLPNPNSTAIDCSFAMYVAVPCGTSFHIPFFDTEGGHLRIYDVFAAAYVDLTAISGGGWFQMGDEIVWQDADCAAGSDPRWNETVTDVSFERPDGICGLFRLEFIEHSGNVWQLYANCTGEAVPQFNLYDSLCGALSSYEPLPNVSILSASAVLDCPDITVSYTVRNDGCREAVDFPLVLVDGVTPVHTEIIPLVPAAGDVTGSFTATFPATPTGTVTLQADPNDVLRECVEVADVGCDVSAGTEAVNLPGCAGACQVVAQATVAPARICEGGSVAIDASTSSSSLCPGGILEYQLRDGAGILVPWQASPTFTGLTPAQTTTYRVDVRCADPAERDRCTDTRSVDVRVDQRPLLDPDSVVAVDLARCNLGLRLQWAPATFLGGGGAGKYNIYRSTVSVADALARPPIAVCFTDTTYTDTNTVAEQQYFYVVEAEDGTTSSACTPRGPCNGGSTTRAPSNGGVGVVDSASARPDLLPKVACSLRAGGSCVGGIYGPTFVDFCWTTDVPLSGDEHFHVQRSGQPSGGFALLTTDAVPLQTGRFLDVAAGRPPGVLPHVFYYLAFTVDACENENDGTGFDRCAR